MHWFIELWNMYASDDERVRHEGPKTTFDPYHQGRTRNGPSSVRFARNTKPPAPNDTTWRSKTGNVDPSYAPYSAQGNFTPTPKQSTYYQTAEHDSDSYRGSGRSSGPARGSDLQETSSDGLNSKSLVVDRDQRRAPGVVEERLQKLHESEDSSKLDHSGGKVKWTKPFRT